MDYTKLINDFLDGKLNETDEDLLFSSISSNKEIRDEFKSYLAIELALKNDSKTFIPPLSSTASILTKIGFAIPGAIAGGALVSSVGKSNIFSFLTNGIYSAIVSSIITALAVIGIYQFIGNSNISNNVIKENTSINKNYEPNKNTINNVLDNHNSNKIQSLEPKSIIKYVYLKDKSNTQLNDTSTNNLSNELSSNKEDNNLTANNDLNEKNDILIDNYFSSLNQVNYQPIQLNQNTLILNKINSKIDYSFGDFKIFKDLGLGVEITGIQDWSLKTPQVKESSLPKFNNMGISLSYKLNNDIIVSADARQEYFYQEFTGFDDVGNKNLYQQFPSFISIGGSLRYNIINFDNVTTFGKISLAGNEAGLIARSIIGFEFLPQSSYSFIFGLEGAMLNFYHKSNYFQSYKLGLNYGIKFNL